MERAHYPAVFLTLTVIAIQLAIVPSAAIGEATEEKTFGEVQPDKALLYLIRPKGARGGNSVALDIFADSQLLVRLRGNSYGFVHLDPGPYTIWGSGCYRDMYLIPGVATYLLCGDLGMATVTEEEGEEFLHQVKYYNPPDSAVEDKRAKKEAKAESALPKLRETWATKSNSMVLDPPAPPVIPSNFGGLVKVPQFTRIEIELMENVSSFLSELGEEVWFRASSDAVIEGQTWLSRGTPVKGIIVEIHGARRGGGSGGFEIAMTSLRADDGTEVALIGQLIDAGRHKLGKAATAAAAGGLLGAAMVKGRQAFELSGEPWSVWTRYDVWVHPTSSKSRPKTDPHAEPSETYDARVQGTLEFNLEKKEETPEITLLVETEAKVVRLELRAVDDWQLSKPVSASRIENRSGVMAAIFDGWSLLRHLPPGEVATPMRFTGRLEDGTEFAALGDISWTEISSE